MTPAPLKLTESLGIRLLLISVRLNRCRWPPAGRLQLGILTPMSPEAMVKLLNLMAQEWLLLTRTLRLLSYLLGMVPRRPLVKCRWNRLQRQPRFILLLARFSAVTELRKYVVRWFRLLPFSDGLILNLLTPPRLRLVVASRLPILVQTLRLTTPPTSSPLTKNLVETQQSPPPLPPSG